jgi:SAM-dependent methyltransferase
LVSYQDRVLRALMAGDRDEFLGFMATATGRRLVAEERLIASRLLSAEEQNRLDAALGAVDSDDSGRRSMVLLEHPRIPFASFPYEWCPEMLAAAGELTLSLAEELLADGRGLKDASPYNVLFRWSRAVFVDVLSIEQRDPGDATWLPFAQFQRNFVLPLLANRYFSMSLAALFLSRRDGVDPEALYPLLGPVQRLRPPLLTLVTLPVWLGRRRGGHDPSIYQRRPTHPEKARFVLAAMLRHLRRQLKAMAPAKGSSAWSGYMETKRYSRTGFAAKEAFVREALARMRPRRVLDVGCNTGHFSILAAKTGAQVVAIDPDPAVIGELFEVVAREGLEVLPLVVDLARPSPALGWNNSEQPSFLQRARGEFDLVLGLAVLHHLLVTDGIPLDDTLALFADLSRDGALIEYVAPGDPMFQRLARGRDHLFAGLTRDAFEAACRRHFEIVHSTGPLDGTRWLYLLRKRGVAD